MIPPGVRMRLTLWYGLTAAVLLATCGAAVFLLVRGELIHRIDELLLGEFGDLGERMAAGETFRNVAFGRHLHEHHPYLLRVADSGGHVLLENDELAGLPPMVPEGWSSELGPTLHDVELARLGSQRVLTAPLRIGEREHVVQLVMTLRDASHELAKVRVVLLTVLPAGLLLSAVGGWWLAGRALSPIRSMTETARRISANRLNERIPVANPTDDLGRLAGTLNSMFERLAKSFDAERRFTADASHELMTPLTVVRAEIDVALRNRRSPEEYEEVLAGMREEVGRLTRLADALLVLSREDAQGSRPEVGLGESDLGALAASVANAFRPVAVGAGVCMDIGELPVMTVAADPERLRPVLINLIDNAIKYTLGGGKVSISGRKTQREAVVEVSDTGIGIPAPDLPKVFDRFYRVDASRSRSMGGAGLGLSIARTFVERHGGRIEVESESGCGSTFRVILPLKSGNEDSM